MAHLRELEIEEAVLPDSENIPVLLIPRHGNKVVRKPEESI